MILALLFLACLACSFVALLWGAHALNKINEAHSSKQVLDFDTPAPQTSFAGDFARACGLAVIGLTLIILMMGAA